MLSLPATAHHRPQKPSFAHSVRSLALHPPTTAPRPPHPRAAAEAFHAGDLPSFLDCPDCGDQMIDFAVPEEYREFALDDESTLALCTHCLALHPGPEATSSNPNFSVVSDAFPT